MVLGLVAPCILLASSITGSLLLVDLILNFSLLVVSIWLNDIVQPSFLKLGFVLVHLDKLVALLGLLNTCTLRLLRLIGMQ